MRHLIAIPLFLITTFCYGQNLTVLADFGGQEVPFVKAQMEAMDTAQEYSAAISAGVVSIHDLQENNYPIESELLSPGRLDQVMIFEDLKYFSTPLAVIGTDSFSLSWIESNRGYFQAQRIQILVTDIPNQEVWHTVTNGLKGLLFVAIDADQLAELTGLTVYPALITNQGIYQ